MENLSRRNFLKRGSVAVAGAGMLAAVPMSTLFPELMGSADAAAPAADAGAVDLTGAGAGAGASGGQVSDTLIAHIRNLGTGEIGVMQGTNEVVIHDPQIAARLAQAMR